MSKLRVLCVDDEQAVLDGLKLHLGRRCKLSTATSGAEALAIMAREPDFHVIISDMRMPGMMGSEFLATARKMAPDTVRMLMTGYSDIDSAIAAINDGHIFRFLSKPVPPAQLAAAVKAAATQYDLVSSQKVLLEQTLRGSIQLLSDVLAISNPAAFGRSDRVKAVLRSLLAEQGIAECWTVEVAAMFAQVGAIALPDDVAKRYFAGQELTQSEKAMAEAIPDTARKLLAGIPRLDEVADLLEESRKRFRKGKEDKISVKARALRLAQDYELLLGQGVGPSAAIDALRRIENTYDKDLVAALSKIAEAVEFNDSTSSLRICDLRVGMVFAEDVMMETGIVFVPKGFHVTEAFLAKLLNVPRGIIKEPLVIEGRDEESADADARECG